MPSFSARGKLDLLLASTFALTAGLATLLAGQALTDPLEDAARDAAVPSTWALSGFVACGAGASTWLFRKGATPTALRFALVTATVASIVLVLLSRLAPPRASAVITASDRMPMREARLADGTLGIEHARLGFRLPHPEMPFLPAPWVEESAYAAGGESYRDRHALWAFQGDATEGEGGETTIMLDLSPGERVDEDALEALTVSALAPLERAGHTTSRDPITRIGRCLRRTARAELSGESAGGRVVLALAVFRDPHGPRVLRLAVTVVSQDGDWRPWIERLELPCG
ncbi:MAG: hypothetical protein OHK0013_30550 [Sandaracinaceae bacterium]